MNSCDCLERGTHEKYQTDGEKNPTRDVISSPEPVCCLLVTLANKRCVEEKTSLPWEVKTTQTMIGSSLTKHLSDRQHTHAQIHKHANKHYNLRYSMPLQMRQKEKWSLTHCCPSKLV